MTSGAHLSAPLGAGQAGGNVAVTLGTTISAGITSIGGIAPGTRSVGSKAPVAVLSRFGVGRLASMISRTLGRPLFAAVASTPYFVRAATGVSTAGASAGGAETKFTAAFVFGS